MTEVKKTPPSLTPPVKGTPKPIKSPIVKNEGVTATATQAPKEAKPPKAPKEPKESAGAGAPRPRKHEYGIKADAIVKVVAEKAEEAKRAKVATAYEYAKGDPTVEAFYAKGGDRHDLRVMSRRGLIQIVWATGETFPQAAVAKAPEAPKAEDAATPASVPATAEVQTIAAADIGALDAGSLEAKVAG